MKKILITSLFAFFLFPVLCEENKVFSGIAAYEEIDRLEKEIMQNISGTTLINDFLAEKAAWEKYTNRYIDLLYPKKIDDVKMLWGSIESYAIGIEMDKMNNFRIKILQDYWNRKDNTLCRGCGGTNGQGDFINYVNELKLIKSNRDEKQGSDSFMNR